MERLKLLQGQQKNRRFYVTMADPRSVARLMQVTKDGEVPEAQRPLNISKVKEIALYAAGKYRMSENESSPVQEQRKAMGIIPNCPILNIKAPLHIEKDGQEYYLDIPGAAEDVDGYVGSIECIDGQHRLAAFREDYLDPDFANAEKYLMGFSIFEKLELNLKSEIFMVSNEKQDRVEPNLLRRFKRVLGLLSEDEQAIYDLIEKLNSEELSVFKGRIVIGAKTVTNGLKLGALTRILVRSKAYDELKKIPEADRFRSLCIFLQAWSDAFPEMFNNHKHTLGKMAGIRFAFSLWPAIANILERRKTKFTPDALAEVLTYLYEIMITRDSLFDRGNEKNLGFRSETGTVELAILYAKDLEKHFLQGSFDIYSSNVEA